MAQSVYFLPRKQTMLAELQVRGSVVTVRECDVVVPR